MSDSNAQQPPTARVPDDTFVQVKPDANLSRQLIIQAGEKMLEHIIRLEAQQAETHTLQILNRSAEMTHTSNNPQLSHRNKVIVLDLMKSIFAQDDEMTLAEFRKRLEALVRERTGHFLGFEY
jgi:hypothetical protein